VPELAPALSLRWRGLLVLAAGAAVGGAEIAGGPGMPEAAGDVAAGLSLAGGAAVAWGRRGREQEAQLMGLTGAAWLAGDLSSTLLYAHRGPLVQLLLTYPRGRIGSPAVAAIVAAAYVDGIVPALARSEWPTIALTSAVALAAAARLRRAPGIERRPRAVALGGAVAIGGTLALAAAGRVTGANTDEAALWGYFAAVAITGAALTADLTFGRWAGVAVAGLVVDLGDHPEPQALRAALARTLGDPSLEIAYRVSDADAWVDESGRPIAAPLAAPDRSVTLVRDGSEPVAALVHDPASLADGALAASVAAAVRLAVANVRLQAEIATRVREVAASRLRLLETGDDERRDLGNELRMGAERRLVTVSERLAALAARREGETAERLRQLSTELEQARADLWRFAQGIHPRTLTERGLPAALGELAAQSAVPVTLSVTDRRFPPALEAAAFFVCSEGLANVAKHATAANVAIDVTASNGLLFVQLADDGPGGADAARGSGLRGLSDRIEALGGSLRVESPAGVGTHLAAELPIAEGDRPVI
jgi:signal transduction histidine kinase